ncbi:4778_t:CDS:2 [Entrophospora sp. SA101]|nr:4778_t:CDS:2 [Entrophospora sp. SA101]
MVGIIDTTYYLEPQTLTPENSTKSKTTAKDVVEEKNIFDVEPSPLITMEIDPPTASSYVEDTASILDTCSATTMDLVTEVDEKDEKDEKETVDQFGDYWTNSKLQDNNVLECLNFSYQNVNSIKAKALLKSPTIGIRYNHYYTHSSTNTNNNIVLEIRKFQIRFKNSQDFDLCSRILGRYISCQPILGNDLVQFSNRMNIKNNNKRLKDDTSMPSPFSNDSRKLGETSPQDFNNNNKNNPQLPIHYKRYPLLQQPSGPQCFLPPSFLPHTLFPIPPPSSSSPQHRSTLEPSEVHENPIKNHELSITRNTRETEHTRSPYDYHYSNISQKNLPVSNLKLISPAESDDASHKMKQEPITPSKIFRTQSTTSINELAKEQEEKGYEEKYDGDLLLGFKSGVTEQDKTLLGNSRTRTTNQDFQKQHEQISSHQEKLTSTIPHLLSHSRTNVDNSLPIDDDQLKEWIGDILKDREFPQFVEYKSIFQCVSRVERLLKEKFMGYEM